MRPRLRPATWPLAAAVALGTLTGCAALADRLINDTTVGPPYTVGEDVAALHGTLQVVDLHGDALLWNRDLLERSRHGHVDLPRMREGNMALQVFGVVTATPLRIEATGTRDGGVDLVDVLVKLQMWPEAAQRSRLHRALYQARKLRDRVRASRGGLRLIRTRADLDALLEARRRGDLAVGAILSLEGAHALEGEVRSLDVLYDAGVRMLGITHFIDNAMASAAQGERQEGLTDEGRRMVARAVERGMVIDLAHASERTIEEVLAMTDRPVVASHGGVRGTCDTTRNLADRHVRAIAENGGVVGIGLFEWAVCGETLDHVVGAMRYVADLVGVEHVALGSDWDGSVQAVFDASGTALLTEALLRDGFSAEQVAAILGGNALRVLRAALPPGPG